MPLGHLPRPLQERLEGIGLQGTLRIAFTPAAPAGVLHIHRTHPLVATLADTTVEAALDLGDPGLGARASALFTQGISLRTPVYLLRLRHQITVERRQADGRYLPACSLLAEECLGLAVRGTAAPEVLTEADALALLQLEPGRNMEDGQKTRLLAQACEAVLGLEPQLNAIAERRADHRRLREASDARGLSRSHLRRAALSRLRRALAARPCLAPAA